MITLSLLILLSATPAPETLDQNKAFLEQQLLNPSSDLRINAIQKLRDLRFADSLSKFIPLLDDPDSEVRFEAIRAIGRLTTPEALTALQDDLLKEKDPYLLSEMKRSIRGIQDIQKAAELKAQEALQPKPVKAPKASQKTRKAR